MTKRSLFLIPALFALWGCQAANPAPAIPTMTRAEAAVLEVDEPVVSATATQAAASLSFTPVEYARPDAGFALQYPADWQVDDSLGGGERASIVQLSSWHHAAGDFENQPVDGTVLSLVIQRWDPVNDLNAFVETRKTAWDASGFQILSEEHWTIGEDQPVVAFWVLAPGDLEALFVFTPIGDQYLQFSGNGDLSLLAEIARTIEPA